MEGRLRSCNTRIMEVPEGDNLIQTANYQFWKRLLLIIIQKKKNGMSFQIKSP